MKYNRIKEIENYIKDVKVASLEDLLKKFDVSIQTLRRDLKELENKNVIRKVYGGIVYNEQNVSKSEVIDIRSREIENLEAKKEIGKLAAQVLEKNDVIFIDSGTTACQIIPNIRENLNLTVITHSVVAFEMLEKRTDIKVILLGGEYRSKVRSFFFDVSLLHYNFTKCFISAYGLSLENGLTNMDNFEGMVKKHVILSSKEVYVLVDQTKFSRFAYNSFEDFSHIKMIITDTIPAKKYVDFFTKQSIQMKAYI